MLVMPSNCYDWFWHCLARETGRVGHLFSPDGQRGPWPWLPYALDNGAFSAWDAKLNVWDESAWDVKAWRRLLFWAQCVPQKPRWAIVPDVPGNGAATLERFGQFACEVPFARALAVQDGMTVAEVRNLRPDVVAVGGTTEWKWGTVEQWTREFPRVHLLRCNNVEKVTWLEALGVESCDGTGWNRGHRHRIAALEQWAREKPVATVEPLAPYTFRKGREAQLSLG